MDPLGAISDSRECVKLDDLVPWQKTLEITDYRAVKAMQGVNFSVGNTKTQGVKNTSNSNGHIEHEKNSENVETTKIRMDSPLNSVETTACGGDSISQDIHMSTENGICDDGQNQKTVSSDAGTSETSEVAENNSLNYQALYSQLCDQGSLKDTECELQTLRSDTKLTSELQFPYNEILNSKIYLWNGDITKLSVQAIILPVYESLSKNSYLYSNLMYSAGPRLINDCRRLTGLRTAEVRVHHGYDLPARYAVHAVEPRFNPKYESAADTALHICYRSALQVCAEKGLRTVAISPLHVTRRGFPLTQGSIVALRTIRKCIEVLESKFDAVVIVTDATVVETYVKLLPAYFPRSEGEVQAQFELLPQNISCNEWGEILQHERAIRIVDISHIKQESSEPKSVCSTSEIMDDDAQRIDQTLAPLAFSEMSGNHDEKRKFMLSNSISHENLQAQERIYKRLLRISRSENFSQFSALRAIKVSGYDVTVNRVVVVIGRMLVFSEIDPEKFLLYLISTFDSVVDEPYTIVYFHTETLDCNRPSTEYLRKLYHTFDQRYRSNLARLCIVHTSRLTRFRAWLNMTFFAREIRDRVVHVQTIPDLYKIVAPNQIDVPPFVLNYDMRVNPQAYHASPRRTPPSMRNQRDSEVNL